MATEPTKVVPLVEWALWWAEQGVPVFPCGANKAPLTTNGFYDAVVDPEKVKKLFDFYPDAKMVGGRMGEASGLLAIDVDLYKPGAEGWMKAAIDNGILAETRTHKTMNGGYHFLYSADEFPTISVNEGVETRGNGGYIILPGSPGYETVKGGLIEAPQPLLEALRHAKRHKGLTTSDKLEAEILSAQSFHEPMTVLAARKASENYTLSEIQGYLLDLMRASVAATPGHERHHRWTKLMQGGDEIARIAHSGYAKFNRESQVDGILGDIAEEVFQQLEEEAEGVFPGLNRGGRQEELDYIPLEGQWPYEGEGYFAETEHNLADQSFTMYPIFAENESVVMFAEPKAGKTAIALTCALHISCGWDYGEFGVSDAGPCLYFGLEGTRAIRLRIAAWKKVKREENAPLPDHIPLFVVEHPTSFFKDEAKRLHAKKIAEADRQSKGKYGTGLKLIVIDTLTKAMVGGDQNSAEDTESLFEIVDLVRQAGVTATVLFVHHKARQGGQARGSSNIEAAPDVLLDVSKEGELVTMKIARARSIEDGISYAFRLQGVDLGKNKQGHPLTGVLPLPVPHREGAGNAEVLDAFIQLGKGNHPLTTVVPILVEHGVLETPPKPGQHRKLEEAVLSVLGGESWVGNKLAIAVRRANKRISSLDINSLG